MAKTYLGYKVIYHRHVDRTGLHLWTSPLYETEWKPGEIALASCDNRHLFPIQKRRLAKGYEQSHVGENYWKQRHAAPDADCNCGFHATWDLSSACEWVSMQAWKFQKEYFINRIHAVLAVVEGGGVVEQGETGFRAEQMLVKGVLGRLFPQQDDFREKSKQGFGKELVRPLDFEQNFPLWDLDWAVLAVAENRKHKKEELEDH